MQNILKHYRKEIILLRKQWLGRVLLVSAGDRRRRLRFDPWVGEIP